MLLSDVLVPGAVLGSIGFGNGAYGVNSFTTDAFGNYAVSYLVDSTRLLPASQEVTAWDGYCGFVNDVDGVSVFIELSMPN